MAISLGVAILAAGQARRFGSNKLLCQLPGGQTLIARTVQQCMPLSPIPLLIVSGAYHEDLVSQPFSNEIMLTYNAQWQDGMSSSIHRAVEHFEQDDSVSHLLIMLADLPLITTASMVALHHAAASSPDAVIASGWEGNATAPAIFPRHYWPQLKALSGDKGAGKLIRDILASEPQKCQVVRHPQAAYDLDTPDTLPRLAD